MGHAFMAGMAAFSWIAGFLAIPVTVAIIVVLVLAAAIRAVNKRAAAVKPTTIP